MDLLFQIIQNNYYSSRREHGGIEMSADAFKKQDSYRIIDHLYDDRKDFIILGLCGRVGSGVSTVSGILEKTFKELQLPLPGYDDEDPFAAHEYRVIHTYARKNWHAFHKIRTSALITRHILDYDEQGFVKYIYSLLDETQKNDKLKSSLQKIAGEFFHAKMECNWKQYYECDSNDGIQVSSPWMLFNQDAPFKELDDSAKSQPTVGEAAPTEFQIQLSEDTTICLNYERNGQKCSMENQDLSKLLNLYRECRRKKSGFKNPFWFIALKQYLYEFLPAAATKLWDALRSESKGLPILVLQCMGNNLRMSKDPYFTSGELVADGYECLAEDINLTIKVLRAYQISMKLRPGNPQDNVVPSQEIRTIIVIDSIKNPFESQYLKTRYSNYYLIGIHTEEEERRKRLRDREHLNDDDIDAIDIIENNDKLKIEMARLRKKYADRTSLCVNREATEAVSNANSESHEKGRKDPSIILKLYNQFVEKKLLPHLSQISPFILQNVSSCLEAADILINNIRDNNAYAYLKKTLLRYVSLIMNPGLVLPTPVERCMQIAYTAKANSGCLSRQVGAAVTDKDYHLLSIGWNQQPEGQMPCAYRNLCEIYHHWDDAVYSEYECNDDDTFQEKIREQVSCFWDTPNSPLNDKGKLPSYCFKDYYNSLENKSNQVHTRALHAEETAFLNLGANASRATGGILFTTSSPCELCAKKSMYLNISKIYYVETYEGVSRKHVLNIGKKPPELILFTGAIGTAYTKLFTPLLPRKDETEMWLGTKLDFKLTKRLPDGVIPNPLHKEEFPNE